MSGRSKYTQRLNSKGSTKSSAFPLISGLFKLKGGREAS